MKIGHRGRIIIPKHLREQQGFSPGTEVEVMARVGRRLIRRRCRRHPVWDFMRRQRTGWHVLTVPVDQPSMPRSEYPYHIARETMACWVYALVGKKPEAR